MGLSRMKTLSHLDDGAIGVEPSLKVSHMETSHGYVVVVVDWWCCLREAAEEMCMVHVRRDAEGPWILEVLSWRAWCSGDPSDGWAEVLLS